MRKLSFILICLSALLPMSMMAQTLVVDSESGLEYLDGGDGRLYIYVGKEALTTINGTLSNNYFVSDDGLRVNWRNNANGGDAKWYKTDLDAITNFNYGNDLPTTYKGIEYFRNLKSLTVPASGGDANLLIDLSKNTKLETLTFSNAGTIQIKALNVSNTKLTSLTIPTKTDSVSCVNATSLTSLSWNSPASVTKANLNVTGSGLTTAALNTSLKTLTNLTELKYRGTQTLDVTGLSSLQMLTCRGEETTAIKCDANLPSLLYLDIHGSGISGELNVTKFTNLTKMDMRFTPVEILRASGLTKLKNLRIKPEAKPLNYNTTAESNENDKNTDAAGKNYLGTKRFYTYDEETGKGCRLKKIYVDGCISLVQLYVTGIDTDNQYYERVDVDEINAKGCTNLYNIQMVNSKLTKLNVEGCSSLLYVSFHNGMLTDDALKESGIAMCPIKNFNIHRNRLKNIDFMLVPDPDNPNPLLRRTQELVDKLRQIQVNGGSYVKRKWDIERNDYDWWIEPGDEYTNVIESVDLSNVKYLNYFLCSDNLLRTIDLSACGNTIKMIEIHNNLFTTVDLSSVNAKNTLKTLNIANQVNFKEMMVLKGGMKQNSDGSYVHDSDGACVPGAIREDGENDIIILPFAYSSPEMGISGVEVFSEDNSDSRAGAHLYDETVADDNGKMDIIHVMEDGQMLYGMKTHDGEIHKHGDVNMHRMVLTYKYPSRIQNPGTFNTNLEPKIHVEPFVVYMNPVSRSGDDVDYFSGTVCLSYQWEVPKGLEAYIAVGVNDVKLIIDKGTTAADGQLNLVRIGKEGDVIPKNVPVYLKTVPAFEDVVKQDGTAAKTFDVEGKNLSHVAGFYSMHKNWEPEFLGWKNTKGAGDNDVRLYIRKNGPTKPSVMGNYVTIDGVATVIDDNLLFERNLFKCYKTEDDSPTEAIYYDTFETEHKYHYDFPPMTTVDNDGTDTRKRDKTWHNDDRFLAILWFISC